ncbi:hypothetical protein BD779DRAFT_1673726 [Infundibulicybe gibba]|nr:hypothetical protein BD779DRAFT_1673726 [Infundibulicybe gibba]
MALSRVAIVTGAGRGMGRAIALRLASDGFNVGFNDLPSEEEGLESLASEITRKGRKAMMMIGDVSKEKMSRRWLTTQLKLGGLIVWYLSIPQGATTADPGAIVLDGRKCRAGVDEANDETTLDEWEHVSLSILRHEVRCAWNDTMPAQELGPHRITVNSYAPGAINTALLKAIGNAVGREDTIVEDEAENCALGYTGEPKDVASLVSYLASEEAHYITGQSISIDGGREFSG